eukprot:CAMPEP_0117004634 /NCGR_PEP_ID=MMETSP0472-20121206/5532_1 /TAXON_ID=693140 ORGANISM="Tiarina fusus, Strain LIS" /NCGR_SAMPLE_ID=MMETSP0472 /ASSEMBLY_ACC=CAM_ASM_000603 /LENGTH=187 /DNA_ID=CAMNT_0004705635 /DNA_START=64 /DNA_END=624 /DNA_ORIENTATION=-
MASINTSTTQDSHTWFENITERLFESFTTCVCGDASMTTTFDDDDDDQVTMTSSPSLLSAQRWSGLEYEASTAMSYSRDNSSYYGDEDTVERRSCSSPETMNSNLPVLRQLPSFSTQGSRSRSSYSYVTADEHTSDEESQLFSPIPEKDDESEDEFVEVSLALTQEQRIKQPLKVPKPIQPKPRQFQ